MDFIKYIENNQTIFNLISLPLSLIALIVSFITLIYTFKMFILKKGIDIRCSYSTSNTIDCDDVYISNITLENKKDKSIVVFQIYLKIGHNYYIKIEDFENSPLIIKPFEVYYKSYDPIIFYWVNGKQIKIDKLIKNMKIKRKIILYTTDGRYEVKSFIRKTNPIINFFTNHSTALISPLRFYHNRKSYGKNIKYLVDFINLQDEKHTMSFQKDAYKYKYKNNFVLTKEALLNKNTLEKYFKDFIKNDTENNYKDVKVYDYEEFIKRELEDSIYDKNKIIEAKYYSFMEYHILGRILTKISNIRLYLINSSRHSKLFKTLENWYSK